MRPLAKRAASLIENRNCAKPAFRKITLLVSYSSSSSSSCSFSSSKPLSRFPTRGRGRVRGRARFRIPFLG
ncbi:hypothetical protein D1AOALGA4SA_4990 [Olavius algarvensis Delta 1 endosymbiont]|nr:hypothetical protein D1AOALGA4SA_4990 [Olavius algarvensis Delta 1 endosymbiont]